jgi:septum formation inhibitor MinC
MSLEERVAMIEKKLNSRPTFCKEADITIAVLRKDNADLRKKLTKLEDFIREERINVQHLQSELNRRS